MKLSCRKTFRVCTWDTPHLSGVPSLCWAVASGVLSVTGMPLVYGRVQEPCPARINNTATGIKKVPVGYCLFHDQICDGTATCPSKTDESKSFCKDFDCREKGRVSEQYCTLLYSTGGGW